MKLKLKAEFRGLIITQRIYPSGVMITLDATQELTHEALTNFHRFPEFHQYLEIETPIVHYTGVEPDNQIDAHEKENRVRRNNKKSASESN